MNCPYCDAHAERSLGWYFDCDNDHTFHVDDWSADYLRKGTVA